jgi:hypothetical protein
VGALPSEEKPQRPRLFHLESGLGIVSGVEILSLLGGDSKVEASRCHGPAAACDAFEGLAPVAIHPELKNAVVDEQPTAPLPDLDPTAFRWPRPVFSRDQCVTGGSQGRHVRLVVDEEPFCASIAMGLHDARLDRPGFAGAIQNGDGFTAGEEARSKGHSYR